MKGSQSCNDIFLMEDHWEAAIAISSKQDQLFTVEKFLQGRT